MQQQHEWLGWISARHVVELDAIGSDVLVLAQRWIQHAVGRGRSLGALEETNWVAYHVHKELQAHCGSP